MRTPGMLDPFSFLNKRKLQEALKQQGEERGWTLMPEMDNSDIKSAVPNRDEPVE